jgi:ABC-type uncharacterized transport system permease subunit
VPYRLRFYITTIVATGFAITSFTITSFATTSFTTTSFTATGLSVSLPSLDSTIRVGVTSSSILEPLSSKELSTSRGGKVKRRIDKRTIGLIPIRSICSRIAVGL